MICYIVVVVRTERMQRCVLPFLYPWRMGTSAAISSSATKVKCQENRLHLPVPGYMMETSCTYALAIIFAGSCTRLTKFPIFPREPNYCIE